jgi:hypothetical protein
VPQARIYRPDQRPDVEVLVDGAWHQGELYAWRPTADGWEATVRWRRGPGIGHFLTSFPADRVRRCL